MRVAGTISVKTVRSPKIETSYWVAILFSQTLGTALGDWMADTNGLGYERGAIVVGAGLAAIAAAYVLTSVSRTAPEAILVAYSTWRPTARTCAMTLWNNGGSAWRSCCGPRARPCTSSSARRSLATGTVSSGTPGGSGLEGIVSKRHRLALRERTDAGVAEDQEPEFRAALICDGLELSNLSRWLCEANLTSEFL